MGKIFLSFAVSRFCRVLGTLRTGRQVPANYWRGLRAADAVIANSAWAVQLARDAGLAAEKVFYIPNLLGQKVEAIDAVQRSALRRQSGIEDGQIVLLYLAGFRPRKGQEELLHLLKNMPTELPWRVCFVGAGKCFRKCLRLALRLNLQQRLVFWGHRAPVSRFLQMADLALLCSRSESQPRSSAIR